MKGSVSEKQETNEVSPIVSLERISKICNPSKAQLTPQVEEREPRVRGEQGG